jgi:hypothetical protein
MELAVDVQVSPSDLLKVEGEPLSFPSKVVTTLRIVVDSGVLDLAILSWMFPSNLISFGVLYETKVLLHLYVMKILESLF